MLRGTESTLSLRNNVIVIQSGEGSNSRLSRSDKKRIREARRSTDGECMLRWVAWCYQMLLWVTRCYQVLLGVTRGCYGLLLVAWVLYFHL